MCDPTQCKIIHPVTLKMFGIKILTLLVLSLTSFMFHLKISPNCTEMADHAFTNNTLFLTIIQCKRVKHFLLYIFFLREKQMCDRGCGKVLKGSKLGEVFFKPETERRCLRGADLITAYNPFSEPQGCLEAPVDRSPG